jgi:glycosyltransferase involved in cell wall biosynthesis
MNITIILPGVRKKPVGGYKIIYKYLKLLKELNKSININIFYVSNNILLYNKKTLRDILKSIYYSFNQDFYEWSCIKDTDIKHFVKIDAKTLYQSDILIATSVETAIYIKKNELDKNKKVLYFIQGFEDWDMSAEKVIETYHYGFKNIVVSKWLKSILEKNNALISLHLPNPVDEHFKYTYLIEKRKRKSILFLYHENRNKGSKEAIEAFIELHKLDNDFQISCFSVFNKPNNLPEFINFYKTPSKEELVDLYNAHTFFLSSSYLEGYGLPPAEAMACGACVITTKSEGVDDFAIHKKTAYMIDSPPNPKDIIKAILYLLENEDLMFILSKNGIEKLNEFTWNTNFKKLMNLLNEKTRIRA